ncbi:MAG: glycoside-pentoside-hexuronide (GPH):cation symporter [Spirochaetaceae bacterium]|jgi:melibiose permease/lactose/raffinose/galactose permease|nr:glycoside-pentoside-hexuronide (GPH):cation symporter [Spirochaetaceae bacterium]
MTANSEITGKDKNADKDAGRNKFCFGLGTIGRDMFYTTVSMFLMIYLTEVLDLPDSTLLIMTAILTVMRVFDAFNDPIMGIIVDNTRGRWGKFKPGIALGALAGAVFMVLMFTDLGFTGAAYAVFFALFYLGWDIFYGLNDIAYWSMLPALSTNQKQREEIGSFARICANIGLFAVVVGIMPATNALGAALGNPRLGWFAFALLTAFLMLGFQCFTLFGVKEHKNYFKEEEKTSFRDMFRVIFKNDQLLWVAVAMALFMIGYTTTANFGVHFFKYVYGDENMYSVFALVLGVSQLAALAVFPALGKKMNRRKLYSIAAGLVAAGYILFFFSPMRMALIGVSGVLIFVGEAFIQILMLMFLADTVEYGQWKFGKRNESVTFSIQPFINKISGALANGILGVTLVISGINSARSKDDVSAGGVVILKTAMLLLPLAIIALGFVIYLFKYKIDEKYYAEIVGGLKERGDIKE